MKSHFILFVFCLSSINILPQSVDLDKIAVGNYNDKAINDPLIDFTKYKTYSIISYNVIADKSLLTLEEKQIEFFLINLIEPSLKLKYIPLNDSIKPDLIFIYDFSNDYKEKYIPPQSCSMPFWSSGSTITINSKSNSSLNTYGDLNVIGNSYGNNNTTINQSGKWEIARVERPAYTEGKYYPNFSLSIYNTTDNNNKVWEGNANGTSIEKDFRLAAQYLIYRLLLTKMPKGSYVDENFLKNNNGQLGIAFYIFNTNGINFYPIVIQVAEKSAAHKMNIRKFDTIISINGVSSANKSYPQIMDMIRGNEGTKIELVIEREGKKIKKTLIKTLRST